MMTSPKMLKILLTGPESTGKSTICAALVERIPGSQLVPEIVRMHLNQPTDDLNKVLFIAAEQMKLRNEALLTASKLLVCDTDLIVFSIWLQQKFDISIDWIEAEIDNLPFDLIFLFKPDIPWVDDPLREDPLSRDKLFQLYQQKLNVLGIDYILVEGSKKKRERIVISAIEKHPEYQG